MTYDIVYALIFWLLWALLAFLILRQFYGHKDTVLANRLRLSLIFMQAVAIILFFFPFSKTGLTTRSGWQLLFQGKAAVICYFLLLFGSLLLLLARSYFILRVAIGVHLAANLFFFAALMLLLAESEQFLLLSAFLSALFLLLADVLCILLLRQIEQLEREGFHL